MKSVPLRHPGNVAVDIEGRLVVADTGNHRILIGHMVSDALDVQHVIGGVEAGFADGALADAAFHEPRGLALSGDVLIVADRGNHAIRMVDLASGTVATVAGTGHAAEGGIEPGNPLGTSLRAPWDVLLHESSLFIAMTDARRIWRLDLREGRLQPHGNGAPGASVPAGPVALATDGDRLYFADADAATVGWVDFEEPGEPEILGQLADCAGLAWGFGNHRLWIVEAADGRLRTLETESRQVETVEPFEAELDHPGGLASAGHFTYVADTNHHRVLRVDQVDKRVVELAIEMP